MASIATSTHLPALMQPHERDAIGHELERTLHDLVALSLIGKQLHWAVVGPLFRPLHQQLDELVDAWRDLADVVAERAVALGYVPDGQAPAVTLPRRSLRLRRPRSRITRSSRSSPIGSRR
jgi:starvation-inducible DNA-binding protein